MGKRIEQVNRLIKEELSKIILRELEFPPGVLVTLTRAMTSFDLRCCQVYVSTLPDGKKEEVLKILNKRIYGIQQFLNKRLNMRPIPRIEFREEEKTSEAGRVEEILAKLNKKEK